MKCDRAKDLFSDILEKSAPEAIAVDFETHLSACQDCAQDYKSFSTVFAALDRGFIEVDPPTQFRDQVMGRLRDQTLRMERESKASSLSFWRRVIAGNGVPSFVTRSAVAAAAALLVFGLVMLSRHSGTTHTSPASLISPYAANHGSATFFAAITQKTLPDGTIQAQADLELPGTNPQSSPASLYVIQSADALSDPAALNDPTKATPIWSGTIQTGTATHVPVSVTSGAPAGATLALLAATSSQSSGPSKTEVTYIPITNTLSGFAQVASGSNLHQAASAIAGGFGVEIMFDDSCFAPASSSAPALGSLDKSVTDPKEALQDVFGLAGYRVRSLGSSAFVVSKPSE